MLTIYKASAGSGKTFTLAYEYIKTLLGVKEPGASQYHLNSDKYTPSGHRRSNRHRGILAITFTNAATEEMKSRIVKELASLATEEGASDSLYSKWLRAAFGCTAEELCQAAAIALAEVLYDYGNFNVSTIDSFFQTVLRTFSREVDHQGDYELSLDTKATVRQSISLMLDELNYARPRNARRLYDWIQQYTMSELSRGNGYNFFHRDGSILTSLTKATSDALDETYGKYADELREYLDDPQRIAAFSSALRKKASEVLQPAREAARAFFDSLAADGIDEEFFNATVRTRAAQICAGQPIGDVTGATLAKLYSGEKDALSLVVGTKIKKSGFKAPDLAAYCEHLYRFACLIVDAKLQSEMYLDLDRQLGLLDFFGMAQQKLAEYLRDNNMVLISDTGELLKRIISDAEMPFIYERLGMKLTNLLIDEFQDTSHLQWHNLKPLVANSLAEGHDNLIIGDEKQAIYRFRNSDSELLGSIVQTRDFPNDFCPRGFDPADNTNHRSAGDIVRVNNTIFSRMAANMGAKSYGNVVQTPCEGYSSQPAYVKMEFFTKDSVPSVETLLEKLAQEILRQHEAGYAWRDILVLARWRVQATQVVEYLTSVHPEIKVLSSESLLLSSSPAVRTVMSMLKLVEGSYVGRKAATDNAPAYASRSDIAMMITRFNYFKAEGYENAEAVRLALDRAGEAAGAIDREIMEIRAENPANLVALIDAIILHKVPEAQRATEYAYLAALQDLAIKHAEGSDPSMAAFISEYDAHIDDWAIKASSDLDAVEIMTVHKSKGLERACVHIPFADWTIVHYPQTSWVPMAGLPGFDPDVVPPVMRVSANAKSPLRIAPGSPFASVFARDEYLEKIDSLNAAYVAFTRARRELIVYSETSEIGRPIFEAVTAAAVSGELADSARMDLAAHFNAESMTLTIGEPTRNEANGRKATVSLECGAYPVIFREDARELTSIDDALSTRLDIGGEEDKEIVDRPGPRASAQLMDAARRGNELHAILAATRTLDDLPAAVAEYGSRAGLTPETQAQYLDELNCALASGGELVKTWFDPVCKIFAERSIYVAESDESFRPDRIVIAPDGTTTIVDYKFTSEPRPTHFAQVENYLTLLGRLGRRNVRAYLWYPLLRRTIEVRHGAE